MASGKRTHKPDQLLPQLLGVVVVASRPRLPFVPLHREQLMAMISVPVSRRPLGENWPFSPREFEWERGEDLDRARRDVAHLLAMLEAGRGDEILVDPRTKKPIR